MAIPETLAALSVPISGLKPYSRNARQGDVGLIVSSLERLGQFRPIVVNARTSEVLAGNHTLRAAQELGWTEIAATFVDVDEDTAARINLVDNRANDQAAYDDQALADLLQSLPDLAGTGYDGDALDELLADLGVAARGDDTEPIEPPHEPETTRGDLYILGEHHLLCGDSTKRADVRHLMGDERASVMFTDPPYGVSLGSAAKNAISGDLSQATIPLAFGVALAEALDDDARLYLCGGSHNYSMYGGLFDHYLQQQPHLLVWVKEGFVMRPNNYHSQFEFIYFGWKGKGGGPSFWFGDRKQSDVWSVARDGDHVHPTQKPLELPARALRNSSAPNACVFEPFGGSGSTLIAAENLERRCFALELDPGYCDVIVDRWERHTGKTAERTRDGETVEAHA